jgi:hypothetical protein
MREITKLYQGHFELEPNEFKLPAGGYGILVEVVQPNGEIRLVNIGGCFLSEDFVGDESTLLNSPALVEVLTKQS